MTIGRGSGRKRSLNGVWAYIEIGASLIRSRRPNHFTMALGCIVNKRR
jgi:hypothetical protein